MEETHVEIAGIDYLCKNVDGEYVWYPKKWNKNNGIIYIEFRDKHFKIWHKNNNGDCDSECTIPDNEHTRASIVNEIIKMVYENPHDLIIPGDYFESHVEDHNIGIVRIVNY